jgi:hypothetical protein
MMPLPGEIYCSRRNQAICALVAFPVSSPKMTYHGDQQHPPTAVKKSPQTSPWWLQYVTMLKNHHFWFFESTARRGNYHKSEKLANLINV